MSTIQHFGKVHDQVLLQKKKYRTKKDKDKGKVPLWIPELKAYLMVKPEANVTAIRARYIGMKEHNLHTVADNKYMTELRNNQ